MVYKDFYVLEDKLIMSFFSFSDGVKFKYLLMVIIVWLGQRKICLGRMLFW